ncbi:MAG: antitoxin family protein [Methanothrix sp.]|jgi:predicted DNA-binding antitoxin AbrB/MazE fold protein|nr:antitoxin family protein [Methanothrix sp.]
MMPVKVRYENNVLKPLAKLDLIDGEEVEIEIIESNADRIVGLLKDIDVDSVDLQHAAREIWLRKAVPDDGAGHPGSLPSN